MIHRIAEKLMNSVYYEISALVSLDEHGEVIEVFLFDTVFAGAALRSVPHAAQLWLMTHHPDGNRALTQTDRANIAALKGAAQGIPVRVFVTDEDIGVTEVKL